MLTLHITPEMRRKLETALAEKGRCRLAAMSFSATAFLALDLRSEFRRTVVVVADSMHSLDELRRNLLALAGMHPERILYYPAWEALPAEEAGRRKTENGSQTPDASLPSVATNIVRAKEGHQKQATAQVEVVGERLQTLERLIVLQAPVVIATCVQALMQMTLSPAALKAHTFRVALGEEHDPEMLAKRLEQTGYAFEPEVQAKGQAAWRGGILDVWPLNAASPFRIEFVGATVETIRSFDPASQRSFARLPGSAGALQATPKRFAQASRPGEKEVVLPPADELNLMRATPREGMRPTVDGMSCRPGAHTGRGLAVHDAALAEARCLFMNYLPPELIYLWSEPVTGDLPSVARHPTGIRYHAAIYEEALKEAELSDFAATVSPLPRPLPRERENAHVSK